MAIGTSLGAYFDDEFHHQAGINTDPSQDRIDVDPEVDPQSTKPKPKLDIMPVSDTQTSQPRLYVPVNKDYDMEGWKAETGLDSLPEGQHYPDTYKLPNHITFSNESKYSNDQTPGGQWEEQGDKSWTFTPSSFNLQQHSGAELQDYFKNHEPDSKLILPDNAAGMAATASGKAVDALKSGKGTPPTIDEDTGINGPILHNIEVGGKRYAITADDRDTAISAAMGVSGGGMSVSKLAPRGSAAELEAALTGRPNPQDYIPGHSPEGYNHGPSPFEQVASAARRARPEDETDRALRMIHEALYPGQEMGSVPSFNREAATRDVRAGISITGRAESFDELMARLDRQDQAAIDAVPTHQFKDYGKVSVADRGYGSFLFKAGDSKALPLNVSEREGGKLLYVNWIGDQTYKSVNKLGGGVTRGLIKALAEKYPDAEEIAGFRISGARTGRAEVARMRIPGRGKISPPRKDIDELLNEYNGSDNTFGGR